MTASKIMFLRPWVLFFVGVTVALVLLQCVATHLQPVVREDIQRPLYVTCPPSTCEQLAIGEQVICVGRIPLGVYSGRRAFDSSSAALQYLQRRGMLADGFAVYQLSGDFDKDAYRVGGRAFTQRTLRVTRRVAPSIALQQRTMR